MSETETLTFLPYFDKEGKRLPDPKEVDKSKYEYVTIPLVDIYDKPHQGVSVNGQKLVRGNTYFMPPAYAAETRERLKIGEKADLRILQSTPDVRSIDQQLRNGNVAGGSTFDRQ